MKKTIILEIYFNLSNELKSAKRKNLIFRKIHSLWIFNIKFWRYFLDVYVITILRKIFILIKKQICGVFF